MGLETAAIMGLTGVASAGLGLAGASVSSKGAQSVNDKQIAASKELQEDAQQYNTDMYERQLADSRQNYQIQLADSRSNYQMQRQDQERFYQKYLTAQGMSSQLQQAGINPGSYLGAGKGISQPASMPSVSPTELGTPSAPSSPLSSVGALQNPMAVYGAVLPQIAGSIKDIASAAQSSEAARETQTLLQQKLYKLIADTEGQEALTTQFELENAITKAFGKKKAAAEILDLTQSAFLKSMMGKTEDAKKALLEIQQKIGTEELKIKSEEALHIAALLKKRLNLLDEQAATERAKQQDLKSSANEHNAGAALKRFEARGQEIYNNIHGLEEKIKTNPEYVKSVLQSELAKARAIAFHSGNEEMANKIDNLISKARLGMYEDASPTDIMLRMAIQELGAMLTDIFPFLKSSSAVVGSAAAGTKIGN